MASISPPRDGKKISVVAIVVDSSLTLASEWDCIVRDYFPHLLACLPEGKPSCPELRLGFVAYGPRRGDRVPVFFKRFFSVGAHNELKENPAIPFTFTGHTSTGGCSGMAALDGYAAAIEMFDELQTDLDQKHKEFCYHLWHLAAGRPDDANHAYLNSSSTLYSITWETLPAELKKISDAPITPWFPICPHHTIHLSGFALSPRPGAMVPPTLPDKRRQESPAEQPARSPRPANQPRQTIVLAPLSKPCFPILPTDAFPLLSPSVEVLKSSSPKYPTHEPQSSSLSGVGTTMAGESVEKTNDGCSVTLESWCMGNPSQARVLPATDQTGDLWASMWPIVLPPELAELPMPISEYPEWIKQIQPRKPPMMQFRPTSGSCQGVEPIATTHVLPLHPQLDTRSPAGQNTIQKLDQQPHTDPYPRSAPPQPPPQGRKRKKTESGEPSSTLTEPRRLRRSHEACARCRSKKIKCDSKHPRCTACATAGTPCHQEDRHRQTLTLRGHTEYLEYKLAQCDALLKRHIPGFDSKNLDEILVREGVEVDLNAPLTISASFQFAARTSDNTHPKGDDYVPSRPPILPPGSAPMPSYYPDSGSVPCAPSPHMQPPSGPIEMQQLTEVSPDPFSPFYPEGPQTQVRSTGTILSFAATATAVAAGAIANHGGNWNGGDDYAQLLAALAT
ncbi:hypothetical protein BJV78DRAFT_1323937 [Lactifluus subvellereus]|nr:hypothetical protein BJV78DRAFT_1323937 [Lactifluus subvellereus]